jgi:hypothetical protein
VSLFVGTAIRLLEASAGMYAKTGQGESTSGASEVNPWLRECERRHNLSSPTNFRSRVLRDEPLSRQFEVFDQPNDWIGSQ